MSISAQLEALIYAAGASGIEIKQLAQISQLSMAVVRENVVKLVEASSAADYGLVIQQNGDLVTMSTKPEYDQAVRKVLNDDDSLLTPAMLETLTIVAYQQPITRLQVDEVRGVNSSVSLKNLQSLGLIIIAGQADEPGTPNLYRTTDLFLRAFGLTDLQQLPPLPVEQPTSDGAMYPARNDDEGEPE
ncbi:SMC-Scp complex subunit ScpB [Fructilactobacillus cliffordii]|uniref:SMC-Scp complex subunit ScpB n=1 Tax=Fructilactobacillus cliffordii TaxID=2940299 RepID=A0A9Q8ZUF7_9LACO|nr:SMC-Scp complex subunit ScpB [Fructilactobacillus cliffordii]USS86615.1 SMC-Scp complex subunit ScpB [Fructilactobacillus cliffordii]USS89610.1 SMC-Scp complex subunit ScpB [Fructilactobacillus cliffordii]